MFKIAILGCENSHANKFLTYIIKDKIFPDIEVSGVYSDYPEAMEKTVNIWGVPAMSSYDELVGQVDGIVVTARCGTEHYRLAKPYVKTGIPMFIDKPITVSPTEAVEFMRELRNAGVRVTGGSSLIHSETVTSLREAIKNESAGKALGGIVRAPLQPGSPYCGFFFYCTHLLQTVQEIFGYYPNSVRAFNNGRVNTVVVRYDEYDVIAEFVAGSNVYRAYVSFDSDFCGGEISVSDREFKIEFDGFYKLLLGGEMQQSYRDFIAPVFFADAVNRAIESGEEIALEMPEEI